MDLESSQSPHKTSEESEVDSTSPKSTNPPWRNRDFWTEGLAILWNAPKELKKYQ